MQLLSRIDSQKAVSQVATVRKRTMTSLPPELSPTILARLLQGSSPSATSVDPISPTLSVDKGGTKPAVHLTTDDGTSFNIGSIDVESLKKIGLVGLVLLATNLIVGLVLLVFAVLNCVRRGSDKKSGQPFVGGTAATQYVPVKMEDDVYPGYQKRYGE
jgi:saccharopepsin